MHSPLLKTAVATLFCLMMTAVQAEEKFLDRVVAVVDKDIILQSELLRRTEVIKQQLKARNTGLPDNKTLVKQVLDKMVSERLQMAQARLNGIRVSDDMLDRALLTMAKRNKLSLENFKQQLELEGQNYKEVREQIREEMLISQTRQRLVSRRIKISDQEVKNFLASEEGKKQAQTELNLAHIMIPIPSDPSSDQISKSRSQAEKVYRDLLAGADFAEVSVAVSKSPRALEGGNLGWRQQSELPAPIAKAVKGLESGQLTQPFRMGGGFQIIKLLDTRGGSVRMIDQTEVRHILLSANEIRNEEQTEQLIRQLRARIVKGEDFSELAKEFSDDTGSGSQGGELGWALPGQMVPAFEQVMNDTPVGNVSPAFKSRFGWHILQVTDRKKEDMGERILANEARDAIGKRKFNEELINWLREIKSEAYIEIKL
ncbi:MAG: peptidylprolyl isomerase [Motiliproteus sp.]|nr:peptidylprolyl isomerase [Motiliproteus sp.]MCW9053076.1 peptidylprolyl isomerase [Motiliproteus sp.]